jgi:hypothetical protein
MTAMTVDADAFLGPMPESPVLSVTHDAIVLDRTEVQMSDGQDEGETKDPHRIAD